MIMIIIIIELGYGIWRWLVGIERKLRAGTNTRATG